PWRLILRGVGPVNQPNDSQVRQRQRKPATPAKPISALVFAVACQEHQPPAAIGSSPDGNAGGGENFVPLISRHRVLARPCEPNRSPGSTSTQCASLTRLFALIIPDSLAVKLAGRPRPSVPHPIATRAAAKNVQAY